MIYNISFCGYRNHLKTMFKKGRLPTVTKGLYGEPINYKNVSLEHLVPVSKGGKTELGNLALASCYMNSLRGNKDLKNVLTHQQAWDYIGEFINIKNKFIKGYVKAIYKTFKELGVL